MKLITPVNISKAKIEITHQEGLFLMGSCFSQNIGNKLKEAKFKTNNNSFGTIFNPISIGQNLSRLIDNQLYTLKDIYNYQDEKLVNFNNQNSSHLVDSTLFLEKENELLINDINSFKQSQTIILTLGTAWVYKWKEINKIVANCHKIPNLNFTKRLLSVEEIVETYTLILNKLGDKNIVFTVSPVRHSKDGLHENNLSKSTLHLAIYELTKQFKNCHYFPAYEIVIDELRDYRFYKEDMVHPTEQAINYVWDKFGETYFEQSTSDLLEQIVKLKSAVAHKPFNSESLAHKQFVEKQLENIEILKQTAPFLDFKQEIKQLNQQK
tara:strand:- start:1686 stop:2657 length:972 start_codon:yes stop_codon:yes gene_type:complete